MSPLVVVLIECGGVRDGNEAVEVFALEIVEGMENFVIK
jgi:hypothetical protein